jgi:hypothetical protein
MLTIVFFDIAPQKNLKSDLVDPKKSSIASYWLMARAMVSIMNHITLPKQR